MTPEDGLQCMVSDDCAMMQVCANHVCQPAIDKGFTFVCTLFLVVSEILPFLTSVRANGIMQALLLVFKRRRDHVTSVVRSYGTMESI